ncbi:MAG: hypothetical protein ACQEXJ_12335 [Myxococcota bacterium]
MSDLPTHSLEALADALEPGRVQDAAVAIDASRDAEREAALAEHHGFVLPPMTVTPLQYQAGLVARERGYFAFDRLERAFLPAPASWRHHDVDPSVYRVRRGPQRVRAHAMWPFRQDAPVADFESSARPRWWSHGLVHALAGFAWWDGLTEWELMHVARLAEAVAALHWYWLGELGRDYCPRHTVHDGAATPACHECWSKEVEAHDPDIRAERIRSESSRGLVTNLADVIRYEAHCFRTGLHTGHLVVPGDTYLDVGEACEYARVHHRRLTSEATRRWMDACLVPGRDYATSPNAFEARCADVLAALVTPSNPSADTRSARARRVLQDVGERLCHAAALRGEPTRGYRAGLEAVAEGAEHLLHEGDDVDPEAVLGEALERAVADVEAAGGDPGVAEIFALGYRPTRTREAEPAGVRAARVAAVRRRARAARTPVASTLEAMPAVVECLVDAPRSPDLVAELGRAAQQAAAEGGLSWEAAALAGWLGVPAEVWGPEDSSAGLPGRWYYRLASRTLPDEARWDDYRIVPNPYLDKLPCPFEPEWLEGHLRRAPDETDPPTPRHVTEPRFVLAGPGRETPRLLPLTPERARLLDRLGDGPRVRDLLDRDVTPDALARALEEELVLCLGMDNPIGRFEPPPD